MATRQGVLRLFSMFSADGMQGGPATETDATARLALWLDILANLTDVEVEMAAAAYLRQGNPWWPKAGQLYVLAKPATGCLAGDEAWRVVVDAARNSRNPPACYSLDADTESRIQRSLAAVGGLTKLGQMTTEQLVWIRKDFVSMFGSAEHRESTKILEAGTRLRVLTGGLFKGDT